jgi:hypothetical protein
VSPWLAYLWPALLLTVVGMYLRRACRDPQTPRAEGVLIDVGLGLVAVVVSVLWLQVIVAMVF